MTANKPVMRFRRKGALNSLIRVGQCALIAVILTACGGGAEVETQPQTERPALQNYLGPAPNPNNPDVQAFRVSLWEKVRTTDRCGQCHIANGQSPMFARSDDVNLAYADAVDLIDRDTPSLSRLVEKVGTGHGCWETQTTACVDQMIRWVEDWVGNGGGSGRQIVLSAPTIKDPGQSKNFPGSPANFTGIHSLLELHCSECHTSGAEFPQQPFFASADIDEAYEAAKTKIDLDNPGNSRLVVRLAPERHNCWFNAADPSCEGDAAIMRQEIENFAGQIQPDEVNTNYVISKALLLEDGIVASGGNRFEDNLIALWEFKEPSGTRIANDTSGIDPAIDLTLSGDTDFIGGWGIRINNGKAQASTSNSSKLYDAITATGEYAIEAWVAPANVTQEEAFIVSYSGSNELRNFTLGQTLYNYDFMNRSSNTDENGMPALSTADADEDLQATLQHVVVNFDPIAGRSIYVNGVYTDDMDGGPGGSVAAWRNNFAFVLGNETSGERQWQGVIRMVAIHNRTLSEEQIQQNYNVGVGQKFFMLFYLGDVLTNIPEPYLMFEVSQFDAYSYLFNEPRFISLDTTATPAKVDIAGIRIGVNGKLADVGQAFQKIDTRPGDYVWDYTPDGHYLSDRGTIIAQSKGANQDEFFLSFDVLGGESFVITGPPVIAAGDPKDGDPVPDFGLRTFEEINASMAALTTVSTQEPNVRNTYLRVKQQLPTVENMGGFVAAHQMAIAQMAIEYCNALVDDPDLRADYWPGVNLPASVKQTFGVSADRNLVFDPLVDRLTLPDAGTGLSSQPAINDIKAELDNLSDRLTACYNPATDSDSCAVSRTNVVMKAVCAAAIGNAAMLVQ
jgi:mono/diheme cytochrome c family protein